MANFAAVTLVGHLGRDPETRYLASGDPVASFSIATTRKRKDEETTTWWRCSLFGKRAEILAKYAVKGDPLLVTGEPMNRPWTDKDGAERLSLEVVVNDFQFLGGRSAGAALADGSQGAQAPRGGRPGAGVGQGRPAAPPTQSGGTGGAQGGLPFDQDIPFARHLGGLEYLA